MAKIKCKCGNTYFARVQINEFHDQPTSLHQALHEVEPDHDVRIYQCISCKDYMLPPVNYFNSTEDDKELYHIISEALKGNVVDPKPRPKSGPLHPGTATFVGGESGNYTESEGSFIPVGK